MPSSLPQPAFSAAWAAAWGEYLNASETYRQAAARWEGDVVLEVAVDADAPPRAVYLDLWHGTCRVAREATQADVAGARYLFRGTRLAWSQVLGGSVGPMMAVVTGKLRLTRGSLSDLLPFATAAQELLASAGQFGTALPED